MTPARLLLAVLALSACKDGDAGATGDSGGGSSGAAGSTDAVDPTTGPPPGTSSSDASADGSEGDPTGGPTAPGTTTGDPTGTTTGDPTDATTDATTGDDTGVACPEAPLGQGNHVLELEHDGLQRTALVHVPPGLDPQAPAPVVLNFHGFTSNGQQQVFFSGMNPLADEEGFIVVYPDGVMNSWNAGACCGGAMQMQVDDVGFVRALVARLQGELCVDARRVYATGMSNGGFMSHRLACEAADLVAAVAPVSCVNGMDTCAPSRPVPVLMFNGTLDPLVSYEGLLYEGVAETFAGWAERDGCDGAPTAGPTVGQASSEAYLDCDAGARVIQWTHEGMGHCWPGNPVCPFGAASVDIAANAEMWAFFSEYALP